MSAASKDLLFQRVDEDQAPQEEVHVDSQKYLIFIADNLKLGVNADHVVEILNTHSATYLPLMPNYIRGIFNMRGQIVPIVDIRLRLDKPANHENSSLLIVLNIAGTSLGILVDAVEQMIDIPNSSILPMPAQSTQRMVSGMCTIPDGSGGTMLVLDCSQLLPHE